MAVFYSCNYFKFSTLASKDVIIADVLKLYHIYSSITKYSSVLTSGFKAFQVFKRSEIWCDDYEPFPEFSGRMVYFVVSIKN